MDATKSIAFSERQILGALFVLSIVLGLIFLNPFIGHWDSYDYMKYILTGQRRTSLMLGRPYFIGYNALLWQLFAACGLAAKYAYIVIKLAIVVMSGFTTIVFYKFFKRLSDPRIALIATFLLATSPVYVVYSGMVMTELPMMFFTFGGLLVFQQGLDRGGFGRMAIGCAIFGFAIGVREQSVFMAPYLLLAPLSRPRESRARHWLKICVAWLIGIATLAVGPVIILLTDPSYYKTIVKWIAFMKEQKALHPIDWTNLLIWFAWIGANQPIGGIPAGFGIVKLWKGRRDNLLLSGFVGYCVVLLISLAWYQDLLYSPRYLFIVSPALALLAGIALKPLSLRWPQRRVVGVMSGLAVVVLLASFIGMLPFRPVFSKAKTYHEKIEHLPPNSVFAVGQYCPYIGYLKVIGHPPTWDVICAGWTWPREKLKTVIDGYLAKGIPLYIDTDYHLWYGKRMKQDLAYWERIASSYRLKKISGTLSQILPL